MRPDFRPPDPHLVRPLRWEWADHPRHGRIVRLWSPTNDAWSQQLAWTGAVHEALEATKGFDEIVDHVAPQLAERPVAEVRDKVGTYLYMLMVEGYVGFDFPPPPERFAPHLVTKHDLGRGGVGVAWLCHDERRGTDVVVKHAWDYFQPMDYTDRIMRDEAAVFAALDHPGVPRLLETFTRDGLLHLVREYVDGIPLQQARPDRDEARRLALQIIDIVQHLMERGHLILDLRPANFFLRPDGNIVLADVGSCIPHENGTAKVRKGIGTPGFTAPEVRRRGRASEAAVVYGCGRLFFQLVAGRRPLNDWGPEDLVREMGDHPMAPLVADATATDPAARPRLADLAARLQSP